MNSPSWNSFLIIFIIVATGYGFILQKEKSAATLVSTYIALVVTAVWGQTIYEFLANSNFISGQSSIGANLNPFNVKILIFAILVVLLSLKGEYISTRTSAVGSVFVLFLYSFFNALLILAAVISFMDEPMRADLILNSNIAGLIFKYYSWLIVIPAIILIGAGFKKRSYQQPPEV